MQLCVARKNIITPYACLRVLFSHYSTSKIPKTGTKNHNIKQSSTNTSPRKSTSKSSTPIKTLVSKKDTKVKESSHTKKSNQKDVLPRSDLQGEEHKKKIPKTPETKSNEQPSPMMQQFLAEAAKEMGMSEEELNSYMNDEINAMGYIFETFFLCVY